MSLETVNACAEDGRILLRRESPTDSYVSFPPYICTFTFTWIPRPRTLSTRNSKKKEILSFYRQFSNLIAPSIIPDYYHYPRNNIGHFILFCIRNFSYCLEVATGLVFQLLDLQVFMQNSS